MKLELEEAAKYLITYLQEAGYSKEDISRFSEHFIKCLEEKYSNCWYPKDPLRGNAFRCLQILAQTNLDPTLQKVFENARLESKSFLSSLPPDFTMWIDPGDVSVRAGKRFAPIVSIYSDNGDSPYAAKVLKKSVKRYPIKVTKFLKTRPSLPPSLNDNQQNSPIINFDAKGSTSTTSSCLPSGNEPTPSSPLENKQPPSQSVYDYGNYSGLLRGSVAADNLSFEPSNHAFSRQASRIFTDTSAPPTQACMPSPGFDPLVTIEDLYSNRVPFNHGIQHQYLMSSPVCRYHPMQYNVYTTAARGGTYPNSFQGDAVDPLFEHLGGPAFDMYLRYLNSDGATMLADGYYSTIQHLLSEQTQNLSDCVYFL